MRFLGVAIALVATLVHSLHFPGLISKDYPYNAELPIRSSYYYTARSRPNLFKRLKRFAKRQSGFFN